MKQLLHKFGCLWYYMPDKQRRVCAVCGREQVLRTDWEGQNTYYDINKEKGCEKA